jgi:glucose 1-dehydrogenase
MSRFDGQVAIISGGAGDIGRAIARELAAGGADVALGDIRPPAEAAALLDELAIMGRRARYDRVDVASGAAVDDWVSVVETELGAPTLIIPNAAVVTLKPLTEISAAEWEREMQVNLNGAFHLARACAKLLLRDGRAGRIVFLGSWAADAVHADLPAYCVSKAGLRMLSRCLALELAPRGILVNEVAPGYVDAGLSGRIFDADPARREAARRTVPIGKLIGPEDVAREVAHLCDPANCHMTGSVVLMDGGLSLLTPGRGRDV